MVECIIVCNVNHGTKANMKPLSYQSDVPERLLGRPAPPTGILPHPALELGIRDLLRGGAQAHLAAAPLDRFEMHQPKYAKHAVFLCVFHAKTGLEDLCDGLRAVFGDLSHASFPQQHHHCIQLHLR